MTKVHASTIRLPDPGAGFVWDDGAPAVVLRPVVPGGAAGVEAAFTTRLGGVSTGPFESLNVGGSVGDEPSSVDENRRRAAATVGCGPEAVWTVRQVHGAKVVAPDEAGTEADALCTDRPGDALAIGVADCVPVLLVGERSVAVAHAGWRGLVAGVVEHAARAAGAVAAFAGPGIGPCCFEVGPDVIEQFEGRFGRQVLAGQRHVDLWAAVERAASTAGVARTAAARVCTSCHPDLLFSHRRDAGRTGRQQLTVRMAG